MLADVHVYVVTKETMISVVFMGEGCFIVVSVVAVAVVVLL